MKIKLITLLSVLGIGIVLFINGCGATGASEDEITISGEIQDQTTGNALEDAIVEIVSPAALRQTTTTDSLGLFSFTVEVDSSFNITIEVTKQGFQTQTTTFKVAPEVDITDLILQLPSESGDGDGDSGGVGGQAAGPAALILENVTRSAINIAETGGIVNSSFTFEVQDSAGRALGLEGAVDVNFEIVSGPGGGETIIPQTVRTNANGRATSSLFAGNTAGVVKIRASVVRQDINLTIQSKPVAIAIHGGFPDLNHFSIGAAKANFEAYSNNSYGNTNTVTVIIGDQFGNPVKPGTAVHFSTTGGIIQGSAQGHTDQDGIASVNIIASDPKPNDNVTGSGGRPGYATVTATTVNANNQEIQKSVIIVHSTSGALISASPLTFDLAPNGGESFTYTVTDLNGNPMAAGTSITISAGEGIEVTGDSDINLGNHLFPGPGATDFSFSIRDTDDESNDPADLTLKITVTSPLGNVTTFSGISGTRRGTDYGKDDRMNN